MLVDESEEDVWLLHSIGPCLRTQQPLKALHDFRRRAEEQQRHALLRLIFVLTHVQERITDDSAEIVVEVLMVLGIKREDVFAQEACPGDFDIWVFETFSVSESVRGTGSF